jgi:hypothetical protein
MAPTPDEYSAPGSVRYDSDTMEVGDGTWDFTKNTFLMPNLQSPNFETMRYNGMGNRFSTLTQYHSIVKAHGVLGSLVFLLLVPAAVMFARFYTRSPGWAVRYHAQIQIFGGLLLLAAFILGFFAVGPERNLSNPHHGIGVAIFVMFILQLVGGRLVRHITKSRSLRVMIHQWSGRTIALLGIAQVPLGLTLYGSPKYLFILYAVWMAFLVLVYFILSFRSAGRRELYMAGGGRSEAGRTQVTESYFTSTRHEGGKKNWLGPLAAGAGIFALMRGRNKDRGRERSRSVSPSLVRSRGPEVVGSRRDSASYFTEKYSDVHQTRKSSGGGFMKMMAGAAAAVGAGKLASNLMNRRERRDEAYSAVSTETPRRHRPTRGAMTMSEYDSEVTRNIAPDGTDTSLLSPSGNAPAMAAAMSAAAPRPGAPRPTTPRPSRARYAAPSGIDESEYSSYVSPSRRAPAERPSGGYGQGIMAGLGMGWIAKKLADRRARKEEERRMREEDDLRSGIYGSQYTGDGHPSPSRRQSQRPPGRRPTHMDESTVLSETTTESSFDVPPPGGRYAPPPPPAPVPMPVPVPGSGGRTRSGSRHSRSQSRSHHDAASVSMPPMPADPHGILHSEAEDTYMSSDGRPQRRASSKRRDAGEAAATAAAARAGGLAAEEDRMHRAERERYGSPQSVSVKLKMHDDKDRNVTLRRLTEEEALAERGGKADTESSLSGIDSPSNRRRYRRDSSLRRAESAAEQMVEQRDDLAPLSPPNPAFARGRRAKDSAYYSGQAGPGGSTPMAGQTVSSLDSHGTWSAMSPSPSGPSKAEGSLAADNRRRRRAERRRGSSSRPSAGADMFD